MIKIRKRDPDEMIPLTYDTVFTGFFNDEDNMEILESLVEIFLDNEYGPVKGNLHIKKREMDSRAFSEKKGQMDVILSMNGVKINLEMNRYPSKRTLKRNAIYASGIYGRGMKKSDSSYEDLPTVVQIDFNLGYHNQKYFIKDYYLMSPEEGDILTKDLRIIYVDLEK